MPGRFNAEISHCSRARSPNAIRPSGIPFPARRGSRVADIGPIANIEKRQSPALCDVTNARKILHALAAVFLHPPAVRTVRFLRFSATVYQKTHAIPKRAN